MNRALPFFAAAAHIAASAWLMIHAPRLWDMLLRGDTGAGLVLVLAAALIVVGVRTSGAVMLLLLARLVALVSASAGRRFARCAIAVSPRHLRSSLAGSAAGLVILGSAAWSPAVGAPAQSEAGSAPAAQSPAWSPANSSLAESAPSPAWSAEETARSNPDQSPGWRTQAPSSPRDATPAWPESEPPPEAHPSPDPDSGHPGSDAESAPPSTDPDPHRDPETEPAAGSLVVAPGDTLWSIAADLHPSSDSSTLGGTVQDLYQTNQDRIGPDPNLIIPGMRLETP